MQRKVIVAIFSIVLAVLGIGAGTAAASGVPANTPSVTAGGVQSRPADTSPPGKGGIHPDHVGFSVGITITTATLFQCPARNCNQGLAYNNHYLADICYVVRSDPWGPYWDLIYDANNDEVGYINEAWLTSSAQTTPC